MKVNYDNNRARKDGYQRILLIGVHDKNRAMKMAHVHKVAINVVSLCNQTINVAYVHNGALTLACIDKQALKNFLIIEYVPEVFLYLRPLMPLSVFQGCMLLNLWPAPGAKNFVLLRNF